ncbi:MAG: hypothetical protein AMXMBFR20_11000 [Planctomycetia bacterium]
MSIDICSLTHKREKMPKPLSFAETIRRAAVADGRTAYRLSKDSGVDVAVVQRFMSGERGLTLVTAEKLCRALGLDLKRADRRKK